MSVVLGACSPEDNDGAMTSFETATYNSETVVESESETATVATMADESTCVEDVDPDEFTNGYVTDGKNIVRTNIYNIMQEEIGMPFGCEVVSLAIALSYYGYEIDPVELFLNYMKRDVYGEANPFYAYVGDPRDDTGYGCYAPCAVRCANGYLDSIESERHAYDISGSTIEEICEHLWSGTPVVIWGTLDMQQDSKIAAVWNFGGNPIYWYSRSHCVVIRGIYKDKFIICDPMVGDVMYTIEEVEKAYKQIYTQAVIIK